MQDFVDMGEDPISLGQRTTRGHDVVEDESTFIHLRKQVRPEPLIGEVGSAYEKDADAKKSQRTAKRPFESDTVPMEDTVHDATRIAVTVFTFWAISARSTTISQKNEAKARRPGEGKEEGSQQGGSHCYRQRTKKTAGDAGD